MKERRLEPAVVPVTAALAEAVGVLLEEVRRVRPLVQNITNFVSMDVAANALLALGASPAMVHAVEEVDEFAAYVGALVINIGTLSADWTVSMAKAAAAVSRRGKPWVLDPVGAGASAYRDATIAKLLKLRPSVVRGNASEIMAVARIAGVDGRRTSPKGVDSVDTTEEATDMAVGLARELRCVVVATGEIDLVTDGERNRRFANGAPVMTRVTALGCALSAVTGAFCAVTTDMFAAASAATAVYGVVGEIAAEHAPGPGGFRVAFLDGLASVGPGDLASRLRSPA